MIDRNSGSAVPPAGTPEATGGIDQTLDLGRPVGEALKDFRIVDKLGEGGMGIVYKAHQLSFDRDVALKILPPHIASDKSFVDRFIREARMSVKLDHPNIVRGVAVGEEHGLHYFAMELVDGHSLDHYLKSAGTLSVGDTVRIIADVARALHHAHSRNILHRDIKPANIMVTRHGQVKLADLGLAKVMDDDSGLTQIGAGAGTPAYMPMEQARNAKDVDTRSDIYALGATMYHLLTGQRPFAGSTAYEVLKAKEQGRYEPASRCNPGVPDALDRILDKAMALDPARRYQDATELIEALEATGLAHETLELAGPGASETATRVPAHTARSQRGTRRVAGPTAGLPFGWIAGGVLAVVLIGGVAAWQLSPRTQGAPPRETASGQATPGAAARRADAEPVDVIMARALAQVTGGEVTQARKTLAQGLQDHPGDAQLQRPLAELTQGVLILFQYQTPEETSPIVPLWSADGVTLTRRDNYRFAMIPGRECYVYAFQRDTRPSVTRLFPNTRYSPLGNPLASGALSWLPNNPDIKGPAWLHLDTSVGEERVFFVAVTKRLRDAAALGQRLVGSTERVRQELSQDLESFLEGGGTPGAPCFATAGNVLQSFAFSHK